MSHNLCALILILAQQETMENDISIQSETPDGGKSIKMKVAGEKLVALK